MLDDVRVRIFAARSYNRFSFEGLGEDSVRVISGERTVAVLPPGEPFFVETWEGMLRVRWDRGSIPLSECQIWGGAPMRVSPEGQPGRVYRGSFHLELLAGTGSTDGGVSFVSIVNIVDIEDYVASVLPSEYPFTEPEGAMAQAVVIRSYALAVSARNGEASQLRDDIGSQVYLGLERETDLSRAIANRTAGSVLLHDGEIVEAVYSSHCGGHSANNEDVWGTTPSPYLRARKDPYDKNAPVAKWSSETDTDDLRTRLSDRLGREVRDFRITDRASSDHVKAVTIRFRTGTDQEFSGEQFRSLVNGAAGRPLILSSIYEIGERSGRYEFKGRGSGHGVGFCQWGAAEQAKQGRDHEDILKFYYTDVDIVEPEPGALAAQLEADRVAEPGEAQTARPSQSERKAEPPKRRRRPGW